MSDVITKFHRATVLFSDFGSRQTTAYFMKNPVSAKFLPRGFALVVTLSLMILLTIVAVGLLTLSSISLRSTSQGDAMQTARANAKVALLLAIGDLQKNLGPDTRISATADQIAGPEPSQSSTPRPQRQWVGAYRSWPAGRPSDSRPEPSFLQWFVSGQPQNLTSRSYAGTSIGTNNSSSVEIVTARTAGDSDPVRVPIITQPAGGNSRHSYGWWVSDLGTKGQIAAPRDIPAAIAEVRADQQAIPSSNFVAAKSGQTQPFRQISLTQAEPGLAKVSTWLSGGLLADRPENIRGLFHDFTVENRGLLTNVRSGGFRKDLSMELQRTSYPNPSMTNSLYQVGTEFGINLHELWAYYSIFSNPNGITRTGSATFTTGGTMPSGTPHFRVKNTPNDCEFDNLFHFKQPVITSYQMAVSLKTERDPNNANRLLLNVVMDPIITLWNPLDIPVVIPTDAFISVKYMQLPYDLLISVNGQTPRRCPMIRSLSNSDSNYLSIRAGTATGGQLVFKPGEVIKVSQTGNLIVRTGNTTDHALIARKGFNYGGGVALPVRDDNGQNIVVNANDIISYQAAPNAFTMGQTSSSGLVPPGYSQHTRHFSTTHHEVYVGGDRKNNNQQSLGYGGMYIDWDFGNKRLLLNQTRGETQPGTKDARARIQANRPQFANVFKTLRDGRNLPANALSVKQPIMLLSFNAKTENNSDRRTKFLSRFNPKAFHVDFYDLSQQELDLLPYEYSVELLSSWKNRSIETSTNGNGFYGGGMTAEEGTSFITTHSMPKEPIVSLASFQHSFANGFDVQLPRQGYAALNAREPMLPQISHAIGNSVASPVLPSNTTQGTLPGGRPLADHSYLANQALWDDWFLSGIAPQTLNTFSKSRSQKLVATEFFNKTAKLPVTRYLPNPRGENVSTLVNRFIPGSVPAAVATTEIASYIQVDGMFNVNSTSVEAWKSLLGSRQGRPLVTRDSVGKETVIAGNADETPVAGLLSPEDLVAGKSGSKESQWVGRRILKEDEIDRLARAIVKEVRKRGPFLSLGDFVNRRVGPDADLARAGAIQSALDSTEADLNSSFTAVDSTTSGRFTFPDAENGPMAFGSPGIIKQADILTPIAPILSARSDSFLVRGYGAKVDASGKILASAWCEAVIQRSPEFVDFTDPVLKPYGTISTINQTFGRRFDIVSFRWLNSSEV
jgi:hypothetical protein